MRPHRVWAALAAIVLAGVAHCQSPPPLDLSRVHGVEAVGELLAAYARAYPELVTVESMGRSLLGRDIWVAIVCDRRTGPPEEKAAIYIDANLHGNETQGTEVCLYTIEFLTRRGRDDPLVERLLAQRVFLIAPCTNPDGRTRFLTEANSPDTSRFNLRPVDDDQDGLVDEDGPEDLDGDGEILQMRRRSPLGGLKLGDDPRILEPAGARETGEWELLGPEGIDNDRDGLVNEDPVGGVDLNRNFPSSWAPEEVQPGAGPYPLSEPETHAIVSFLMRWPNLAAAQSYHNYGEMILRPPGSSTDGDADMPVADLAVFDALGKRGEELLPGYRYLQTHEGLYPVNGGFHDYCYFGLGVIGFTNELWNFPGDLDGDGQTSEAERLQWNDAMLAGAGFRAWTEFAHPTYGRIEIGGWRKLARRIPPAFQMEEMCYRNMLFTLVHADAMPRLEVADIVVTSHSSRLHTVDVTIANRGLIPTATEMAQRVGVAYPDLATLAGRHTTVLGSGILVGQAPGETRGAPDPLHGDLQTGSPATVSLGSVPGHGAVVVRFVVEGWKEAAVEVVSQKGGRSQRTFLYKEE